MFSCAALVLDKMRRGVSQMTNKKPVMKTMGGECDCVPMSYWAKKRKAPNILARISPPDAKNLDNTIAPT